MLPKSSLITNYRKLALMALGTKLEWHLTAFLDFSYMQSTNSLKSY